MKYSKTKDFFNKIAKFYDIIMRDIDYNEWAFYIKEIINKFSKGNKILDIACGTGKIIEILNKNNFEVFGLDLSFEMLKIAKNRKLKNLVNSSFFKIPFKNESFDIVISTFDSLNNVQDIDEIKLVFEEVYRILKKDGIFTFDLNTIHVFRTYWNNLIKIDETKNLFIIWKSRFIIPNSCSLKIIIFERRKKGYYKKYEMELLETAFEIEMIIKILRELNFSDIRAFEHLSFRRANERNYRVQFIAKK